MDIERKVGATWLSRSADFSADCLDRDICDDVTLSSVVVSFVFEVVIMLQFYLERGKALKPRPDLSRANCQSKQTKTGTGDNCLDRHDCSTSWHSCEEIWSHHDWQGDQLPRPKEWKQIELVEWSWKLQTLGVKTDWAGRVVVKATDIRKKGKFVQHAQANQRWTEAKGQGYWLAMAVKMDVVSCTRCCWWVDFIWIKKTRREWRNWQERKMIRVNCV